MGRCILGAPLPDYTTWNVGVGLTWNVFTLSDVRYYDTNLSEAPGTRRRATSPPPSARPTSVRSIRRLSRSQWCGQTFVISLKGDLTWTANLIKKTAFL